jgi:uncharacterized protein (DUF305 family)
MKIYPHILIAASLAYALPAASQMVSTPTTPASAMQETMPHGQMHKGMMGMSGSDSMKKSMMTGMDSMDKMKMTGDIDKDFAMMMKIHHQQAVEMSEVQIANGKSPEMKKMALSIIAAQKKEIAMFDVWLAKQK